MLSALVAWTALLTPQEGGIQLQLPDDPETVQFSPHRSAQGEPTVRPTAAADAADLDGDGNRDLWFLAAPGSAGGGLEIQMADTGHLGRYLAWHTYPSGGYTDAATFRSTFYTRDRILMADPSGPGLRMAAFQPGPPSGDPRDGTWFDMPNFWLGETGIFEVATRNDSGDRHDDVVVLIDLGSGFTLVRKLVIEGPYSPQVTAVVEASVPLELEQLTLLDLDGDGRTDFAVTAPGLGMGIFRDDGLGAFTPVAAIADPAIRALFAGDLLGTGRDALGVCVDVGVLIGCFTEAGVLSYWLPNVPSLGPLARAELLAEAQDRPEVVVVPRDGSGVRVYPFDRSVQAFGAPAQLLLDAPSPVVHTVLSGDSGRVSGILQLGTRTATVSGIAAFAADVDADGDRDVLMQRSSGATWIALPNTARSLALGEVTIEDLGQVGETGYSKQEFTFPLPDTEDPPFSSVEAAVYLVDQSPSGSPYYWGRLLPQVDPVDKTVSFTVYTQTDPSKLSSMFDPYLFGDGITAGGQAAITVHGIEGSRRFQSVHLFHDPPGGDGNGSGPGATWTMTAAPPLPTSPQALLPWGPPPGGG